MNREPASGIEQREWNAARACEFWPDQRGHWAPVSWKDHLHDFNVFFNGTIAANPGGGGGLNRNIRPEHQAHAAEFRIKFYGSNPDVPTCDAGILQLIYPDGMQIPSWEERHAPVYVLEHGMMHVPVIVRQKQFAHVPGGGPLKRGDEPHFLWVRIEIADVVEIINHSERIYTTIAMLAPSCLTGMGSFNNINFNYGFGFPVHPSPVKLTGPADLSAPAYLRHTPSSMHGLVDVFLHGQRNRLAFPARQKDATAAWLPSRFAEPFGRSHGYVVASIPARLGAKVDFVIPMLPVEDDLMDRELALGYDGALKEAERFWTRELRTRTAIRVPEPLLQGVVNNYARIEAMIAEKHPESGEYGLTSGSFHYEAIWATPMSLCAFAMEFLGHGNEMDKYLDTFRRHQGTIKPPSPYLEPHPGYLGAPKTFTSIDWLPDHGAILWMAANHALLTMDRDFLKRWKEPIVKACRFITDALANRKHKGYRGVMPTGVANDCRTDSQSCWVDAWTHKGLRTAAILLHRLRHPRAKEFLRAADAYRDTFQKAYRDVVGTSKTWTAPDGARVPFTPPTLAEAKGYEAAHAFNLDSGASALVFGGLFPASDPVMKASLRWFREGPQVRLHRPHALEFQVPCLVEEVSSCEPCYSWNIFHTLELGDRPLFTRGLYGLFAAGMCRRNFVSCETREAVFGNGWSTGTALSLMRLSTIEETPEELHLLRMTPLAFFAGTGFLWKNVPTWFGEITIGGRHDESTRVLEIEYRGPTRGAPTRGIHFHIPPLPVVSRIFVNGERVTPTGHPPTIQLD